MDYLNIILNFLLGSGIVSVLFFYRSKRRKENAEAVVVELGAFTAQINHLSKQLKESFAEIDLMQDIIDKKRQKIIELSRKLTELELRAMEEERKRRTVECKICNNSECTERK